MVAILSLPFATLVHKQTQKGRKGQELSKSISTKEVLSFQSVVG